MRHQEVERDHSKKTSAREMQHARAKRNEPKRDVAKKEKTEEWLRPPDPDWRAERRYSGKEPLPAKIVQKTDGKYPNTHWRAF